MRYRTRFTHLSYLARLFSKTSYWRALASGYRHYSLSAMHRSAGSAQVDWGTTMMARVRASVYRGMRASGFARRTSVDACVRASTDADAHGVIINDLNGVRSTDAAFVRVLSVYFEMLCRIGSAQRGGPPIAQMYCADEWIANKLPLH
jgi:hypothetical protein